MFNQLPHQIPGPLGEQVISIFCAWDSRPLASGGRARLPGGCTSRLTNWQWWMEDRRKDDAHLGKGF